MERTLKNDVIGQFKKICYGYSGDKVTVIADHGNMLVVEGKNGNRYPVHVIDLIEEESIALKEITPVPDFKTGQISLF